MSFWMIRIGLHFAFKVFLLAKLLVCRSLWNITNHSLSNQSHLSFMKIYYMYIHVPLYLNVKSHKEVEFCKRYRSFLDKEWRNHLKVVPSFIVLRRKKLTMLQLYWEASLKNRRSINMWCKNRGKLARVIRTVKLQYNTLQLTWIWHCGHFFFGRGMTWVIRKCSTKDWFHWLVSISFALTNLINNEKIF